VSVTDLVELVRIEGNIRYDASADEPVHGLTFRGLTFTQGNRYEFHGRTGSGLQHDWERFDASTALVRLRAPRIAFSSSVGSCSPAEPESG